MLISTLWVSHAAIAPALPDMANAFSHVKGINLLVKMSLTIASLFIGLLSPITGAVLDRFGRLPTLFISMLLFSISGASVIFINDIYIILITRAVLGASLGAMITAVLTLIGDYYEGEQRKYMVGVQSAFVAIGGIVYIGGNGYLTDISWKAAFFIYAIGVVLLPFAWLFFEEPDKGQKKQVSGGSENEKQVYLNSSYAVVIWVIFSCMLVSIFFIMIHTQLPFLLKEIGYNKNIWLGIIAMAFNITAVISSFLFPWLKSRYPFRVIYFLMFLFFAIGYFMFGYFEQFNLLLIGALVSGIGVGFIMPNTSLWLLNITSPDIRGKIMGIMTFAMFLGQFLSPLIIQPLTHLGSLKDIFTWSSIFMGLFSLLYLINFDRRTF